MWNEKIFTSQVRNPFAPATSPKKYGAKNYEEVETDLQIGNVLKWKWKRQQIKMLWELLNS